MLFAVVFAVNGLFLYFALSTRPGVVNTHPFEAGVSYNHILEQVDAQKQRGWQSSIKVSDNQLQLSLHDKQNTPIADANVTAILTHPVSAFTPQRFTLSPKGNGRYTAPFNYPHAGQWDIQINATWNNQPFHQTHRMIVQ